MGRFDKEDRRQKKKQRGGKGNYKNNAKFNEPAVLERTVSRMSMPSKPQNQRN